MCKGAWSKSPGAAEWVPWGLDFPSRCQPYKWDASWWSCCQVLVLWLPWYWLFTLNTKGRISVYEEDMHVFESENRKNGTVAFIIVLMLGVGCWAATAVEAQVNELNKARFQHQRLSCALVNALSEIKVKVTLKLSQLLSFLNMLICLHNWFVLLARP